MATELFLIRHAEAEDKTPEIKDLDRQLSPIGMRVASRQGEVLKGLKIEPNLIVSSNAARAYGTAQFIAERVGYDPGAILINDEVYEASVRTLLQVINQLNDEFKKVFVVGHNPSMSYLAEHISKSEIGNLPPGAIVRLKRLVPSWSEIEESTCELLACFFPEDSGEDG